LTSPTCNPGDLYTSTLGQYTGPCSLFKLQQYHRVSAIYI
jgi:hypothetical protein